MTRSEVIYDMGLTTAFTVINNNSQDLIHFHSHYLLEGVEKDFDKYINELKSKQDNALRDNFDKMYKIV